jgi:putative Mn2+ efflux pump MntP
MEGFRVSMLSVIGMAFALAMDAFAVSITGGVVIKEQKVRHAVRIALFFGGFQAVMPLVGWLAGIGLKDSLGGLDHWLAFGLLTFVGCKMIYESFKLEPAGKTRNLLDVGVLLLLSVATSIDALAVGMTLSVLHEPIMLPAVIIGVITFVVSLVGVLIGDRFGHLFESKIEIIGGLILIAIGVKTLIEHLVP